MPILIVVGITAIGLVLQVLIAVAVQRYIASGKLLEQLDLYFNTTAGRSAIRRACLEDDLGLK